MIAYLAFTSKPLGSAGFFCFQENSWLAQQGIAAAGNPKKAIYYRFSEEVFKEIRRNDNKKSS